MATPRIPSWALAGALLLAGCNGHNGATPLLPSNTGATPDGPLGGAYDRAPIIVEGDDNFVMPMGRVQLAIRPDLTGELLFTRQADVFGQLLTTDITGLYPDGWPNRYVHLQQISRTPDGKVDVDLSIDHPFPAPDLGGVVSPTNRADLHANHLRAIFFLDGTQTFNVNSTSIKLNPGFIVNADGYTNQFPAPTGSGVTANVFPYVVFGTDNPAQMSAGNFQVTAAGGKGWNYVPPGSTESLLDQPTGFNVFAQGTSNRGTFLLDLNAGESTTLDFVLAVNYAPAARSKALRLQAEYYLPATAPQEAWRVTVDRSAGGLEAGLTAGDPQFAATATYDISIYDWQHGHYADVVADYPRAGFAVGLAQQSDIATVKVAIPALATGDINVPVSLPAPEDALAYGLPLVTSFTIDNTALEAPEGTYLGLVEVTDERLPETDLADIGDGTATFGIDASTLEFRTLPSFKTYQLFTVVVGEGNLAPTARATATTSTTVAQGGTVSFNATLSSDPNADPLTLTWDFNGDGLFGDPVKDNYTGTATTPVHTFLAPGAVSVNLKVEDGRGGSDTLDAAGASPLIRIPVTVTPVNIPPVACATAITNITYVQTGQVVTFDATCSFDTSTPLVYEWDFNGDNVFGDAWDISSPTPPFTVNYIFPASGVFNVKVRVRETATPQLYQDDSDPIQVVVHRAALLLNNPTAGSPRYYGHNVALGDLNNDGLDDLVVSATGFHTAPTEETTGRLYIYFNRNVTLAFPTNPDVTITAIAAGGWNNKGAYGYDLAIGDMNGDNWNDIAVGMNGYSGAVLEGRAEWIINGGASAAPAYFVPSATIPTAVLRPTTAVQVVNPTPGGPEQFGTSLDVVDLDQDGNDDIVVGAIQGDRPFGHDQAGECYAFRSNGLTAQLIATLDKNPFYSAEFLGAGITAGDYDNDGDCDVIGGGISIKTSGVSNAGALCYWKNHKGEPGYTFPYMFGGVAPQYGVNQFLLGTLATPVGDSNLGFMLRSGDIDNDGYDDLVAAAPGYTAGNRPVKCGGVMIYKGSPSWVHTFPSPIQALFSTQLEAGAYFGHAITLGDVDGDGDLDLVASSPYHDTSGLLEDTGLAEVFKWNGSAYGTNGTLLKESWSNTNLAEAGFGLAVGKISMSVPGTAVAIGAPRGPSTTGAGRVTITQAPY